MSSPFPTPTYSGSNLVEHIRRYVHLSDDELLTLLQYIKPISLKRKAHLISSGEICKSLFFVEKGCLRMYFLNNKAAEQTTQFAIEKWWIADYFSFMDQKPSEYFIQSIEKSEIIAIDNQSFNELVTKLPVMEHYFRIVMQRALAASQQRLKYMYEMSKEEFYQHFATSFPEFNQRVPQYMIASFLGLTPEYVSELRKKK
ncbi:MAG: Crp/Fnr family transcriptional regulator [Chitinophagales bacterium]|jgi:CRP/FNR family transcriptional regulator|nr:Crp/Fnr family transcriptional regulator [Chitinophagales bacterium]